jgi:hypothetical protein
MIKILKLLLFLCAFVLSSIYSVRYPYYCKARDRTTGLRCNREYRPVCGWFNRYARCVSYPCAKDFQNACTACLNRNVEYITYGNCPSSR